MKLTKLLSACAVIMLVVGLMPLLAFAETTSTDSPADAELAPGVPDVSLEAQATQTSTVFAVLYKDGELVFQASSTPESGREVEQTYTIPPNSSEHGWYGNNNSSAGVGTSNKVKKVTFTTAVSPSSTKDWFFRCANLTEIVGMETYLDTSNVTDMSEMFQGCAKLTSVNLTGFNTSSVTDMTSMFNGCSLLETITLNKTKFNTSKVTSMGAMFYGCRALTSVDVSGFDVSKVEYFTQMFAGCNALESLDVSGFNTASALRMDGMFLGCTKVPKLDLSGFIMGSVTASGMANGALFLGCNALSTVTLGADFRFASEDWVLPTPPTNEQYTGKWVKSGSSAAYTAAELLAAFTENPASMAGTYVWQEVSTIPQPKISLNDATVVLSQTSYTYDGNAKTPSVVSVTLASGGLVPASGYDVSYSNNTQVGTSATVTVTGKGDYEGSASATFEIKNPPTSEVGNYAQGDGWWFENFSHDIELSKCQKLFDEIPGYYVWADYPGWGGVCYGMSASAAATAVGSPSATAFGGAAKLYDVNSLQTTGVVPVLQRVTCLDYILYSHLLQDDYYIGKEKADNRNNMAGLVMATRTSVTGGEQIVIGVRGLDEKQKTSGHALWPLRITADDDEKTQIAVYDCNHPTAEQTLTLTKSSGVYTGWSYHMWEGLDWGSNKEEAAIYWSTPLDDRERIFKGEGVATAYLAYLFSSESVTLTAGGQQYTAAPDSFAHTDKVLPALTEYYRHGNTNSSSQQMYWTQLGDSVKVTDIDANAKVSFASKESGVTVQSAAGSELDLTVGDDVNTSVGIKQADGSSFAVEYADAGEDSGGVTTLKVEGLGASQVSTAQLADGNVSVTGAKSLTVTNEDNKTLTAQNLDPSVTYTVIPEDSSDTPALIAPQANNDAYAILYSNGDLVFQRGNAKDAARGTVVKEWTDFETGSIRDKTMWRKPQFASEVNYAAQVKKAVFKDVVAPEDVGGFFRDCSNMKSIEGLNKLDTSKAKNLNAMFVGCSSLTTLDVSSFNTSNVTELQGTFNECSSLISLDLSKWNVSKVTNMGSMFRDCKSLKTVNLKGWNTSSVVYFTYMFYGCESLISADLSSFNTSKVTDMNCMFLACFSLQSVNLSSFNTSKTIGMIFMFEGCYALKELNLSSFDSSSLQGAHGMLNECTSLSSITIGNNFRFTGANHGGKDDTVALPDVPSNDSYTGQWKRVSDGKLLTSAELMESTGDVTGKWVWNTKASSPDNPSVPDNPSIPDTGGHSLRRLQGNVALDTMKAIVDEGWAGQTGGTVVLTTQEGYWDALTAAGVAGMAKAPVLMSDTASLSEQTRATIAELAPKTIVVCGGPAAVTDGVANAAAEAAGGARVVRCAGQTATGTAVDCFKKASSEGLGEWAAQAFVCTNDGYWDALAAAPISYAKAMPIFLTEGASDISDETLNAMKDGGIKAVYIVGGEMAINDSVKAKIEAAGIEVAGRLWGETAVETSENVASFGLSRNMTCAKLGIATTEGYWDALAGAPLCGLNNSVLVLAGGADAHSISGFVTANKAEIAKCYIFGGEAALDTATYNAIQSALS